MSKSFSFRTIIEPDDPKGYHGYVPALKGVHTCGDTIEEVKKNLQDAIKCHLESLALDKVSVPEQDETMEYIQTVDVQFPYAYA
jgi:predicted RNase H-like HicB family nuclease